MAYDSRALVGIGGWLAFFIVTLAITSLLSLVQVLAGAAMLSGTVGVAGSPAYGAVLVMLGLLRAGGYGFLIWRLNWRQVPSTPRIVVIGLWALAIGPTFIDAGAAASTGLLDAHAAGYALGTAIARPLIYAAIWTAYLLRSERVANTYSPDTAEAERLAAVFD